MATMKESVAMQPSPPAVEARPIVEEKRSPESEPVLEVVEPKPEVEVEEQPKVEVKENPEEKPEKKPKEEVEKKPEPKPKPKEEVEKKPHVGPILPQPKKPQPKQPPAVVVEEQKQQPEEQQQAEEQEQGQQQQEPTNKEQEQPTPSALAGSRAAALMYIDPMNFATHELEYNKDGGVVAGSVRIDLHLGGQERRRSLQHMSDEMLHVVDLDEDLNSFVVEERRSAQLESMRLQRERQARPRQPQQQSMWVSEFEPPEQVMWNAADSRRERTDVVRDQVGELNAMLDDLQRQAAEMSEQFRTDHAQVQSLGKQFDRSNIDKLYQRTEALMYAVEFEQDRQTQASRLIDELEQCLTTQQAHEREQQLQDGLDMTPVRMQQQQQYQQQQDDDRDAVVEEEVKRPKEEEEEEAEEQQRVAEPPKTPASTTTRRRQNVDRFGRPLRRRQRQSAAASKQQKNKNKKKQTKKTADELDKVQNTVEYAQQLSAQLIAQLTNNNDDNESK
eukprot:TRINITY_DN67184_c14_g1_i1.p1 TRINITY_DN67184_c14_g1~~TRINITY_DN67184_c14_g1_i1.p1  ORF type:complete len:525 (-),score=291.60 TRINITY_DN67184_c14_g1_i1:554-2059(-)